MGADLNTLRLATMLLPIRVFARRSTGTRVAGISSYTEFEICPVATSFGDESYAGNFVIQAMLED